MAPSPAQKGGAKIGPTKRGKGSKIMAVADAHGLPLAAYVDAASPHEVRLVERTLTERFTRAHPVRLIGDRAYDSDPLDATLLEQQIEMISPHKSNRVKPRTQDGRPLRRYRRRWRVERLFAWLQHYRRVVIRYEYHAENYFSFVLLGFLMILLRHYF